MKCFVYRAAEGEVVQISKGEFNEWDHLDPIDHIEKLAAELGLNTARKGRTITVCVSSAVDEFFWRHSHNIPEILDYLGY